MSKTDWKISKVDSFYRFCDSGSYIPADVEDLIKKGNESSTGRARLCLHRANSENLHVMLIYHDQRTRVPIHRHMNFGEQIIATQGDLNIDLYDDSLILTERIQLGLGEGSVCSLWIPPQRWHTLTFSKPCLFFEISTGALNEKSTHFIN